ncbi:putative alkaline shock family protein YloU [Streptomyces sp. V4I8]
MSTTRAERLTVAAGERGRLEVADRVVRRVAQRAATEALPAGDVRFADATVMTRSGRIAVSVDLALPYQAALEESGRRVQQCVAERTAELTGLKVSRPRIRVRSLTVPDRSRASEPTASAVTAGTQGSVTRRPGRTWSERRVPSALAALTGAAACALLLHDFILLRGEGRPQEPWRSELLTWLSTHGPGDFTVALGTALTLLGIQMVLLAVLPGRRRLLSMRPDAGGVRSTLDQHSAEQLMHQAVLNVPGVSRVRVRVRRRRARVRAVVEFGDPDAAHRAMVTAANRTLDTYGLGRAPRLRVRMSTGPGVQASRRPKRHRAQKEGAKRKEDHREPSA